MENQEQNIFKNGRDYSGLQIPTFEKMPKEFERDWIQSLDKRFMLILLASFIMHFVTVSYYAFNPPSTHVSEQDIKRIQDQFAHLVLKKEVVVETEEKKENLLSIDQQKKKDKKEKADPKQDAAEKEETGKADSKETKVVTAEDRKEIHGTETAERRRTREQIAQEVSSKGLLGLLAGSGSAAVGEGVVDVLSDVDQGGGNLDDVFGQIDGLKRADASSGGEGVGGKGSRSVKGNRVTSSGGIDDLLTDRGTAKSTEMERGGDLVVSSISSIENADGVKSSSRDADDVSLVVNNHNSAIQTCYQRELKRNPDLKGKVVIRFTIDTNGIVTEATIVQSTLNNDRVEQCILNRIKRWNNFGAISPSKSSASFRQVYTFGY